MLLNFIGVIILAIPALRLKDWLEDERIVKWGKEYEQKKEDGPEIEKCWAIRGGQIKFRKAVVFGLLLTAMGLLFQALSSQ